VLKCLVFPPTLIGPEVREASDNEAVVVPGAHGPVISVVINSVHSHGQFAFDREFREDPSWAHIRAVSDFLKHPSKSALATCLKADSCEELAQLRGFFPWLLQTVLAEHLEGVPLDQLAEEVMQGDFGEPNDWIAAELRWKKHGFKPRDFLTWNSGRYITREIARVGAPWFFSMIRRSESPNMAEFEQLVQTASSITARKRARLVDLLCFALDRQRRPSEIFKKVREVARDLPDGSLSIVSSIVASMIDVHPLMKDEWFTTALDQFGRNLRFTLWGRDGLGDFIVDAFNEDPTQRGLLSILSFQLLFDKDQAQSYISRLDVSAFQEQADDEPTVQTAVSLLQVISGRWHKTDISRWVRILEYQSPMLDLIPGYLKAVTSSHPARFDLLKALIARSKALIARSMERYSQIHNELLDILASEQDSRLSFLTNEHERMRLKLSSMVLAG
jgi:hypothetical protein